MVGTCGYHRWETKEAESSRIQLFLPSVLHTNSEAASISASYQETMLSGDNHHIDTLVM